MEILRRVFDSFSLKKMLLGKNFSSISFLLNIIVNFVEKYATTVNDIKLMGT
jgi:hypothetical protein